MTQKINYQKYMEPLLKYEDYFIKYFSTANPPTIKKKDMDDIYDEYKCKHTVFNRDEYKCHCIDEDTGKQCERNSPVSIHHYKHKFNNGKWSSRNCLCVCRSHQNLYHNGKGSLTFVNKEYLPPRIRGQTQILHQCIIKQGRRTIPKAFESKEEEIKVKQIRKNNKEHWGRTNILTLQEIVILFAWLFGFTYKQPTPSYA